MPTSTERCSLDSRCCQKLTQRTPTHLPTYTCTHTQTYTVNIERAEQPVFVQGRPCQMSLSVDGVSPLLETSVWECLYLTLHVCAHIFSVMFPCVFLYVCVLTVCYCMCALRIKQPVNSSATRQEPVQTELLCLTRC